MGELPVVEHFHHGFPFVGTFPLGIVEQQLFFPRHIINHPTEKYLVGRIALPGGTTRQFQGEVGGHGVERTDSVIVVYVDGPHAVGNVRINDRQLVLSLGTDAYQNQRHHHGFPIERTHLCLS